jgi:hypothetical protein
VRFPFIYGQNCGVRIPLSPPVFFFIIFSASGELGWAARIEFGQQIPGFSELHRQRFIRHLEVRTDFFEKIALGFRIPFVRPWPGRCVDMTRAIPPDFLPDVSRPWRGRLAGQHVF